jgi:lambda repressor-like predicted transcriptional regulator
MNKSILEQLKSHNISALSLANDLQVNRSVVYQSINGNGSRKIRLVIAKKLQCKPSDIWTDNDKEVLKIDDAVYLLETERRQ